MDTSFSLTETKNILKSLVRSCPSKITIENLSKDYGNTMGCQIPFRKFGYRTLKDFLYSIPDTISITNGRNPLLSVASSEKTMHMDKMSSIGKNVNKLWKNEVTNIFPILDKQKQEPYVPPHLRFAPSYSRNMTHITTKTNSNVVDTIIRESTRTKYSIKCNQKNVECEKKDSIPNYTAIKENYFKGSFSNGLNVDEAVPNFNNDDDIFLLDFPTNTVKFGCKIKSFELPNNLKDGDVFPLFVTEINNPYKFWFHIAKQNDELDEMMKRLEYFYENIKQEFVMQLSNVIPGQICAALYSGLWHRAEILGMPKDGKVKVCFIDYGTVFNVPTKSIKYLSMEFAKLNKQALRGCLSHIRPSGLRWSRDSTYSFLDMVADKLLYGKVTQIIMDEKILRIVLTDTNQDKDFQINNALILKGHARLNDEIYFRLYDKFYYPTFEMLENGEYPTFHEIGILLAQGIDYETKVYNNIICDVTAKKCSLEEYIQKLALYHIKRKH